APFPSSTNLKSGTRVWGFADGTLPRCTASATRSTSIVPSTEDPFARRTAALRPPSHQRPPSVLHAGINPRDVSGIGPVLQFNLRFLIQLKVPQLRFGN